MKLKYTIKKILKENLNTPSKDKFAEGVLKFIYKRLYAKRSGEQDTEYADEYPGKTLEEYVTTLKKIMLGNNKSDIDTIFNDIYDGVSVGQINPLLDGIEISKWVKWVYEFVINYNSKGKRIEVDVIPQHDFFIYFNEKIFVCDDEFFEFVWDKLIGEGRNYWNEGIKEQMWEEIEDEVIEKMEDEEWQEENGVSFDDLNREKSYFKTYWHYPIDSLGWYRDDLCELYKDTLNKIDDSKLFNAISHYQTKNIKKVFIGAAFYYIIDKNLFF